jgi:hypothetical protein
VAQRRDHLKEAGQDEGILHSYGCQLPYGDQS